MLHGSLSTQGGDKLYAQLDIWRNSAPSMYDYPSYSYPQPVPTTTVAADMSVDLENIFDLISSAERPESAEPPTYTDLLPKQQQTEQIIRSPPPPYPEQPGPSGVEKIETTSEGSAQEEEEGNCKIREYLQGPLWRENCAKG